MLFNYLFFEMTEIQKETWPRRWGERGVRGGEKIKNNNNNNNNNNITKKREYTNKGEGWEREKGEGWGREKEEGEKSRGK